MTKVTFIAPDGSGRTFDAKDGMNAMELARDNGVTEIVAECGGAMACATCHVIVDKDWADKVGAATEPEGEMLEFAASDPEPTSRLSCQITLTDALDGLVLHLPESQI